MRNAQESVHIVAATVGFTSLGALWFGILWGTILRSGWAISRVRHSTIYGIHMNVVLFGLWLAVVHALTQLAAPQGKVGWLDELVPFINEHDPIGIGMGVVALEMMLAFALSVVLQRRLGYHRWRTFHSFAYLAFTLAVGHVLVSGTDVGPAWIRATIGLGWAVVMVVWLATLPAVTRLPQRVVGRFSGRLRGNDVTVNVDPGRCGRFGFCEHEAPAIFSLRSDGRLAYRPSVPADQAELAVQAALVCPARAITLGRLPTAVVVAPREERQQERVSERVAERVQDRPRNSALEDTGRHHLPPIRQIGGRAGGRR